MNALSQDPKIVAMARSLKLNGADPLKSIIKFCRKRVAKMLKSGVQIQTIWDFESLVCRHLNLVIHEVWNDDEIQTFSIKYARDEGDPTFGALGMQLEGTDTYGVLYQRKALNEVGEFQYVAFVDCRGDKRLKRFFTRWHEIAHCLTIFHQLEFPFRRTNVLEIEKDPIEKLTDMIAADLGFLETLFQPVLNEELQNGKLTFDTVENVRGRFCPDASFQSTLHACVSQCEKPIILLEVGLGLKYDQKRALHDRSIQLIPTRAPQPCLRALGSISNSKAREIGFIVHKNWRIPQHSIIAKIFNSDFEITGTAVESLGSWKSSSGGSLKCVEVEIHVRKVQDRVFAILSLAE